MKLEPEAKEAVDARETALEAGLRYVTDEDPGIRRRRCGKGFTYVNGNGKTVRSARARERIAELVIPPAWEDVWICAHADGHIQATGRDGEGRKQYLYHHRWRVVRDREKYRGLGDLGRRLPALRQRVGRDLGASGVGRRRVVAGAVRLLDRAALRVGSEVYTEENESFGLTTLRKDQVRSRKGCVRFQFDAKGGQERDVAVRDVALARLISDLRRTPTDNLFVFHDGAGDRESAIRLRPEHVNDYLRDALGADVTAKDFRTWAGCLEALRALSSSLDLPVEDRDAAILGAVDAAAEVLGNQRSTAREFYVHPGLLHAFEAGELADLIGGATLAPRRPGFRDGERLLLALLPHLDALLPADG
jgi:DNA topoisomerase-1